MKFKPILEKRAKLKKCKECEFAFTEEQIAEGRKATFDKPYLIPASMSVYGLYLINGKLHFNYYHSYDVFEELPINDKRRKVK